MMKRSLFLSVAAGLLASVAFATPSQAGTEYLLNAAFDISPNTIFATEIDVTLNGAAPATGYTVTSPGGLSISSVTGVGNVIEIKFGLANHTTPTTNPAVGIEFTSPSSTLGITTYDVTGGNTGNGYRSSGLQVALNAVPEPGSFALLGIGMTGFLAFRRMFKRNSAA